MSGHGRFPEPLACELFEASLENSSLFSPYEALSYVWGDPAITSVLSCSGRALAITINLEAALLHLRNVDESRILWIDAVCSAQ
jgi:hypothetical protein